MKCNRIFRFCNLNKTITVETCCLKDECQILNENKHESCRKERE